MKNSTADRESLAEPIREGHEAWPRGGPGCGRLHQASGILVSRGQMLQLPSQETFPRFCRESLEDVGQSGFSSNHVGPNIDASMFLFNAFGQG